MNGPLKLIKGKDLKMQIIRLCPQKFKLKKMNKKFELKPIGIIHSPYKTKEECPIQGPVKPEGRGRIEIYPQYEEGLYTIETFSHIVLLYLLHKAGEIKLRRPTFLDDSPHGVFASRHPCRPNGIGFSTVKLEKREKNFLEVSGIDVLDQTPLIDIKPYVPKFDSFKEANNGWIESKIIGNKPLDRE
jgi:tRNA-Thr(GGU) m(6)t(6)A37 methyltransferase TsaA